MSHGELMDAEFDTRARWTAQAVLDLGQDHALPASCQGSGSPAALEWLGTALDLARSTSLLDSGAGLGGPAEFMARRFGVRPTLADPEIGACRAARNLFGLPVVMADGAALPFRDRTFDTVLSLGVLCTLENKAASLAEATRVLAPGGGVGLLVFVKTIDVLPEQPGGNHFPLEGEMVTLLHDQGLVVEHRASLADFSSPPAAWSQAVARVESRVEQDHAHDEGWRTCQRQEAVMQRLMAADLVVGRLLVCRARGQVEVPDPRASHQHSAAPET